MSGLLSSSSSSSSPSPSSSMFTLMAFLPSCSSLPTSTTPLTLQRRSFDSGRSMAMSMRRINPSLLPTKPTFFPANYILPTPSLFCSKPTPSASTRARAMEPEASPQVGGVGGADTLRRFVHLNSGNWNGSFYQFDPAGNVLNVVSTRLAASSYGEDELISLIQTLYIKQAPSRTSIYGSDDEPEWVEYKIKECNMFTVDKYQEIGFFPNEKAFSLRYQTAGMLETVLRAGVLGEDDTGEESPKNLKIPSRRPALVCENCVYSLNEKMRARAFHTTDPRGDLEMLLIFIEQMEGSPEISFPESSEHATDRLTPFLGRWEGHSITKRSGVYGATIAEADTTASLQINEEGRLIQDITSTNGDATTNVRWEGKLSNNLIRFEGGFELTLLPGGMYMGCPSDISKSVSNLQSFHLEFCWVESPDRRQRLVRTYDAEGLTVSSTYFYEVKVSDRSEVNSLSL